MRWKRSDVIVTFYRTHTLLEQLFKILSNPVNQGEERQITVVYKGDKKGDYVDFYV